MKYKGREIYTIHHQEWVSRQDNMSCGLSNPRLCEWAEYSIKNSNKIFYKLSDIKKHIDRLKPKTGGKKP